MDEKYVEHLMPESNKSQEQLWQLSQNYNKMNNKVFEYKMMTDGTLKWFIDIQSLKRRNIKEKTKLVVIAFLKMQDFML